MSALTTNDRPRQRPGRGPAERPRPRLRVVPHRRHRGRYVAAMMAIGVLFVFGILSFSALAAESAFEARSLEEEIDALAIRYDALTAEVARLESPGRVRAVATEELGMVPADQPAYLVVEGSGPTQPSDETALPTGGLSDPVKSALGSGR